MKGWSELLLCAAVITAAFVRTPVGALTRNAVQLARGGETEDVLASFRTSVPQRLDTSIAEAVAAGPGPVPAAPGGWSPALQTAVRVHLGADALEARLARASGDPTADLEVAAIGRDARDRAIRRARAAGASDPGALDQHRRYLSDDHARLVEEQVVEVLALSTALDLAWPVDPEARVSSGFGYRDHPVLKKKKLHEGVDIAIPVGTPVHAAGGGTVTRARKDDVNGNYVSIDHGHGVRTAYCHGDALHTHKGDRVRRGDHVMDSGNTGRSTGPHLHFGLRIHGRAVDPAPFRALAARAGDQLADSSPAPGGEG